MLRVWQKIRYNLLLCLFSLLLIISAWQVISILRSYQAGKDSYDSLAQYVSVTAPADTAEATTGPTEEAAQAQATSATEPDDTVWPQVEFAQLAQINPDIVGWIFIEGTNINYPVVQGTDNDYYLKHLFDGTENRSGCIFLDKDCSADFSDPHSIIYGHHLKDKTMFTGLMQYKQQSFFDEHPVVLIVTPSHRYRIRLFSGYVCGTWANAWEMDFSSSSFADWLADIAAQSGFTSPVSPAEDDLIVTLSTCTYEFDNAKYVLHGFIEKSMEVPLE